MRLLGIVVGISLLAGTALACDEEKKGGSPTRGSGSAAPAAQVTPASPPEQLGPLVDLISRQVRAARTVHAETAESAAGQAGQVQERIYAQLRTDAKPPSARLTIVDTTANGETTEAVITGGVIYTRVKGEDYEPGKPWVRLSRQDASNPELGPFGQTFTKVIDGVEKSLGELTSDTGLALVRKGTLKGSPSKEDIGGTSTKRYDGTTQTSAMAGTDKSFGDMNKAGLETVTWSLWVDDKSLPRRFTATFATPDGTKVQHTTDYKNWGASVDVQAPPANQVAIIGD